MKSTAASYLSSPPPLEFTEKSKNFIEKSKIIYGEVQKKSLKNPKNVINKSIYQEHVPVILGYLLYSWVHQEIRKISSRNPKKITEKSKIIHQEISKNFVKKSMSPGTSTCHPGVSPLLWGSPTAALSKDSHLAPKHAIQSCLFKIISF